MSGLGAQFVYFASNDFCGGGGGSPPACTYAWSVEAISLGISCVRIHFRVAWKFGAEKQARLVQYDIFSAVKFLQFFVIKTLDLDPHWNQFGSTTLLKECCFSYEKITAGQLNIFYCRDDGQNPCVATSSADGVAIEQCSGDSFAPHLYDQVLEISFSV